MAECIGYHHIKTIELEREREMNGSLFSSRHGIAFRRMKKNNTFMYLST